MNRLIKKLQSVLLGAALVSGLAWSLPASASDIITFDPTGGGAGSSIDLLDQSPGNALAVGANIASTVGSQFTLLYQANLNSAQLAGSNVFTNGSGSQYFTFAAGFGEIVLGNAVVGPSQALAFGFDATNPTNFFTMYATGAVGNNLAGTGFVTGTPILSGYFVSTGFSSNFLVDLASVAAPVALDQAGGTDNYPGVLTLTGAGSSKLQAVIDFVDAGYFPDLIAGDSFAFVNTSQILPFLQIDPSACLSSDGSTECNVAAASAFSSGEINGVSQPNTLFQADANTSFTTIPEPMSLLLIGTGLIGLGFLRRRRAAT